MRVFVSIAIAFLMKAALCADPSAGLDSCLDIAKSLEAQEMPSRTFCVTGQIVQITRIPVNNKVRSELSIRDESGYVTIVGHSRVALSAGDIILADVEIKSDAKTGASARFSKIRKIGRAEPPAPVPRTIGDILSGNADWSYVRTRGIINSAVPSELSPNWVLMTIVHNDETLLAVSLIGENHSKFESMIGADVELTGVVLPQDRSRRLRAGRIIRFNGLDALKMLTAPPTSSFDAPDISHANKMSPADVSLLGHHTAAGRVLTTWNGKTALIRLMDNSIIKVGFRNIAKCKPGDFIKAVGLPESDLHHVNLIDAVSRPIAPFPSKVYPTIEASSVLSTKDNSMSYVTDIDGRTIHLVGIVRTLPSAKNPDTIFHVESCGAVIPVNYSSVPEIIEDLQVGCQVDITGVCVMSIENWRPRMEIPRINGFFISLNSSADVRIVSRPSWWTPIRLLGLVTVLVAMLVAILIWNAMLRRLAFRRGNELLREQLKRIKAILRTEERTHLAVELHDTIAQNLTGVSLEIDAAVKMASNGQKAMMTHLGIASRALKSCRDELRNCLWDLRNRALEANSMKDALRQTLAPHLGSVDADIRFSVPRERISDNTAHAILRIVRELTINAIRHGHATKVWIAGCIDGERMAFSVRDNGCGFIPASAPGFAEGHYGLLGIQERVNELEGDFKLDSAPGKGTKAIISFKVPQVHKEA